MQLSDRQRLSYLYMREGWRRFSRRLALGRISAMRFSGGTPDRLIVAPTDLHPADSFAGEEITAGRFPLAGRSLDCEGESPFALELPSEEFAVRLHCFGWLRHMRLVDPERAAQTTRFIVDDWLQSHGRVIGGLAWRPDVTAQRIIAWLSHSPVVLKDADYPFYRRFLKSLAFQVRYLRHVADTTRDGEPRLRVRIALAMASIAMPSSPSKMRKAARHLDEELDRQILPDGGHCSRNPRAALDLLLDLLPLRQTYVNLGHDMPAQLIPCIDRIYPALRFFRHQGGELALFNGATYTLANELMSALRYDETGGAPFKALPSLNYDRVAVKDTVVLMDTGAPKSVDLSSTAAAGALSVEISSGKNRFIVNSGRPRFAGEGMRQMSRMTAAHSVATLNDTSSSRISGSRFLGPIIIGGVSKVNVSRIERDSGAAGVTASHDGYLKRFGLLYERDILVSATGGEIRGRERFFKPATPNAVIEKGTAVVRFHIHPTIQLYRASANETRLVAPDGEAWSLTCLDVPVEEEEDVFFADPSGVRPSRQLTLTMPLAEVPEVQWSLARQR
ncbi:heparinase II/III family protein [Shinella sp. CPCC 101442]|uniref:heparinase II/III family protein n=1 Tax=Shinella sp. CPCC 101442 TaxID=2932265 RepID=UPI00215285CB|nr:heparinase II/III family protein [Shinella sp. CPCC 101442]MCR6501492.1 heparinase II/III family protein [Shinella sp. CPCC 101442]